jgi:hypothetical protein
MELFIDPGFAAEPEAADPITESAPFVLDGGDRSHDHLPELPAKEGDAITEPYRGPAPAPWIATLPLTGVVLDSGQITFDGVAATGRRAVVGTNTGSRPGVLGIMLRVSAGAGVAMIMPDGQPDSERAGFNVGNVWTVLPLKRACLWLTTAAVTVDYLVLIADSPALS